LAEILTYNLPLQAYTYVYIYKVCTRIWLPPVLPLAHEYIKQALARSFRRRPVFTWRVNITHTKIARGTAGKFAVSLFHTSTNISISVQAKFQKKKKAISEEHKRQKQKTLFAIYS
jgi:hypothetical protein